ncbi:MAG TPA: ABC transporter ATP-binding protein [Methanocorpusculum sp.]|nr:ABC transporter ATP-binding protein [Methanocorpusculum sp.]
MNSISAEHITTGYADRTIIDDLTLAVEKGGFLGIIGVNGCGKTTLLRSMTRILKPNTGVVYVDGREIESYNAKDFARIVGCVNQMNDAAFEFSVKDVVMMGRHPYLGRLRPISAEDFRIADEAMSYTHVLHLKDRLITELSGGERQRVLIAKTIAQQPEILLLDEPTNHLDISHQIEILQLLKSLTPKITVVCVLHDLNLASCFCDTLVLMDKGKIIAAGTPSEVLTPKRIYDTFSVKMMVSPHPVTGKPYLVPEYGVFSHPGSKKIHVISGGGTGTELIYALAIRGFAITAGVLSANDSDAAAASTLGIETIIEPPFSAVSSESAEKLKNMIAESDIVVVSGMPVGCGNIANISVLLETDKPVYFLGAFEDYTKGKAEEIREKLISRGAYAAADIQELLAHLNEENTA